MIVSCPTNALLFLGRKLHCKTVLLVAEGARGCCASWWGRRPARPWWAAGPDIRGQGPRPTTSTTATPTLLRFQLGSQGAPSAARARRHHSTCSSGRCTAACRARTAAAGAAWGWAGRQQRGRRIWPQPPSPYLHQRQLPTQLPELPRQRHPGRPKWPWCAWRQQRHAAPPPSPPPSLRPQQVPAGQLQIPGVGCRGCAAV